MNSTASGEEGEGDELFGLFEVSAKFLARSGDPAAFRDWFARAGPALAPEFARGIDPRTGPPGLAFRAMGVAIYSAMPLPDADFKARRIPEPGRNDACRALWERDGALAWLRAAWSEVRRSAGRKRRVMV